MYTLAKLFGKSPFTPLRLHMELVSSCIHKLPELFQAFIEKKEEKINLIAKEISKIEHEADITKDDIRTHFPKSLFLPIDRTTFLQILSFQDDLADKAENISVLITLKELNSFESLLSSFEIFWKKNLEVFNIVQEIIKDFDVLLESAFGGMEAKKIKDLTKQVAHKEYEADILQQKLLKILYGNSENLHYADFYLWLTLIREVGALSDISENLANLVRTILEIK